MWASALPLFEWKINLINANYPPDYKVYLTPSPWVTKLGESLEDRSYIFHKVFISVDQKTCLNTEDLNIVAQRPSSDKALESISVKINNIITWFVLWGLVQIILSGIYMWWVIIWREHRRISEALGSTLIILVSCLFLVAIMKLLGPRMSWDFFTVSYDCYGALTYSAELSKMHYEVPVVMLIGIFAELGALSIMAREIIRAIHSLKKRVFEVRCGLTQRAPDWWESARFQTVFVAWSWFRQNGVSRPAHQRVTQTVRRLRTKCIISNVELINEEICLDFRIRNFRDSWVYSDSHLSVVAWFHVTNKECPLFAH
jgi:hypothetical protein